MATNASVKAPGLMATRNSSYMHMGTTSMAISSNAQAGPKTAGMAKIIIRISAPRIRFI
jgi:hypothetical protein